MRKVIIVDDSATARMFTRRCLEMAGLQAEAIIESDKAREVLKYLNDPALDLLVIDLVMPEMTGKELLVEYKRRQGTAPVVVISSAINQAEAHELEEMGANIVLKKPISPAAAFQLLQQLGRGA